MLKVALRKKGGKLTPYISSFSQNGRAQKQFAATYGKTIGGCVASRTAGKKGINVTLVAKECSRGKGK